MRRLLPLLAALGACSGAGTIRQPAEVGIFGAEARLETWDAEAAEGIHLHPAPGAPCLDARLVAEASLRSGELKARAAADAVAGMVEEMAARSHGPAYGGPGRLTLALRRGGPGGAEALVVSVPIPEEGVKERSYDLPEVAAGYHRPPPVLEAVPVWCRAFARRLGPGRYRLEAFLVLRNESARTEEDRALAVIRAEFSAARAGDIR